MSPTSRQSQYSTTPPRERLPEWLSRPIGTVLQLEQMQHLVKGNQLHTICEEGRCPNRGECYQAGTASFLLGGSICTRSCAFCQVTKGEAPQPVDPLEAGRVADAVKQMGLGYVVLTAVARDDLLDHGVSIFTHTMAAIRHLSPLIKIEVLTPDFWGGHADPVKAVKAQRERLITLLSAEPDCFNHNLETVESLQGNVRRGATYRHSLNLLAAARELAPNIPTKSGLMLGLGETHEEVIKTLEDLRSVDCQRLTLGQYLRPSLAHIPVQRYWHPDEFNVLAEVARKLGFAQVRSGPLVRSSYHAGDD